MAAPEAMWGRFSLDALPLKYPNICFAGDEKRSGECYIT
jgi:hypothetical protein